MRDLHQNVRKFFLLALASLFIQNLQHKQESLSAQPKDGHRQRSGICIGIFWQYPHQPKRQLLEMKTPLFYIIAPRIIQLLGGFQNYIKFQNHWVTSSQILAQITRQTSYHFIHYCLLFAFSQFFSIGQIKFFQVACQIFPGFIHQSRTHHEYPQHCPSAFDLSIPPLYLKSILLIIYKSMSIIIKSDELNILIYKYLQECNLTHTAFNLFNEANLEQSLTQYKFDVKSGQLVSLIQRALIFSQIQSHITVNDYEECKQPFMLLKPHVCKITQKIKADKEKMLQQLNQISFQSMRKTNSIHNVLQPNRQYEEIIYEQRSPNFLDRIPLRLEDCQKRIIKAHISSKNEKNFCAFDCKTKTITIMQVNQQYLLPISILPCMNDLVTFQLVNDSLITISEDNIVEIIKLKDGSFGNQVTRLKIPLESPCIQIKQNKRIFQLILFQAQDSYVLINTNSRKRLASGKGVFEWIEQFEYLVLQKQSRTIKQFSLKNADSPTKQFVCDLQLPEKIKISFSEMYFSVQSIEENKVLVYNFDSEQPIYIFDFKEIDKSTGQSIEENIRQVVWITANSSDSLVFITESSIKTFEVMLNNFSKITEISPSYDKQIKESAVLRKNDEQMYLICSGVQNLIFYDVGLGKIERVQKNGDQTYPLIGMNGNEYVTIMGGQRVYFLQSSDVDPLFL